MAKDYVEISQEQMEKLPTGFTLWACPYCECGLFAVDQGTLEDGGNPTELCCLGCGKIHLV